MKTIGLLGGMSWESTVPYYQIINRTIARRLGGLHSARLVLYSVDFDEIAHLQHADRWTEAAAIRAGAADGWRPLARTSWFSVRTRCIASHPTSKRPFAFRCCTSPTR